jgi:quinol---cytochrome c reductase iron-sulfur subunit
VDWSTIVSAGDDAERNDEEERRQMTRAGDDADGVKATHTADLAGVSSQPSDAELNAMSREELVALGGRMDGVETIYKEPRWPVSGTRAEKRTDRQVALWLLLGGLFGLALLLVFLFWPWEYKPPEAEGSFWYSITTPLYGVTFGLSILSIAVGVILFQKKFIPEEISIQERHDGGGSGSAEIDRKTVAANLTDAFEGSTLRRRKLIRMSLGIGFGTFGLGTLVAFFGGLVKNPWKPVVQTADGKKALLWTSGWTPRSKGETIYLARATGDHLGAPFVKMRPEDVDAGGMETVFPWRESDGDGTTPESHEKLQAIMMGVRNPVMLIRVKPGDMSRMVKRKGQESFNFGEFFAYTKVCSHLGCPSSLYEQQSYRILCPCHQSQFDALQYAKPIFGPAARALAQLPITIDSNGYLVANGDFIEPVGPAFWERTS